MTEWFTNLTWQDFVTASSVIFGLITLIAYLDQRKSNKEQKKYLEFVNRHLDRDITKEEVENLKSKQSKLQLDIDEKLPTIGRTVVLQDQADFYQKGVFDNYQALEEINSKLNEINSIDINEISPELKDYILKEISPKYRFDRLITQTRDKVLGLLALIIVIGTIIPFGIDYYIQFVLGIYMIGEIIKYMVLNVKEEKDREKIYKNGVGLIMLGGLGLLVFSTFIIIRDWGSYNGKIDLIILVWGTFALIGILLMVFANIMVKSVRVKIEREMGQ